MALCSVLSRAWPADLSLVLSPRSGRNLFFRFFFVGVSDSRTDRPTRDSSCGRLPSGRRSVPRTLAASLVCAYRALAFQRAGDVERAVLGRHGGVGASSAELVASWDAGNLLCLFSFFHRRGSGFLELPVGRDVARSRIHLLVLCAARISPRAGAKPSCLACQSFPSAMGMVPDLLRVWNGEDP